MSDFSSQNFQFCEFAVEPKANLLIKNGQSKRLESKVIQLLVLLAGRANKVTERQFIIDSIWPNTVVGDEAISRLVFALRAALGDDAKSPKYIETIPKKGYRFLAAVQLQPSDADSSDAADNVQVDNLRLFGRKTWLGALFFLLSLIALIVINKPFSSSNYTISGLLPVTKSKGSERDFGFHPSKESILYIHEDEDGKDIYSRSLSTSESKPLTNDDWYQRSPLWLDEHTLVYIRHKGKQYQIVRQNKQGRIDVLYEAPHEIFQLAISPQAPQLITFNEFNNYENDVVFELKVLSLISGDVSIYRDTVPDIPNYAFHPAFSDNGQDLYFHSIEDQKEIVVAINIAKQSTQILSDEFIEISDVSVTKQEQLLICARYAGVHGLWLLEPSESIPTLLLASSGSQMILQAEITQDDTIYYSTFEKGSDISIADVAKQSILALPQLNTYSDEIFSVFSKDKRVVYFVSNRSGYYELWRYQIDNGETKQITHLDANWMRRPAISPSGQFAAFTYKTDQLKMTVFDLGASRQESVVTIEHQKFPLAWSTDERAIFVSEHKQQINVYKYDRQTLESSLINDFAGLFAHEETAEQSVRFVDYRSKSLASKNLVNGEVRALSGPIRNLNKLIPGQLQASGEAIFYISKNQHGPSLVRQELNSNSSSQELFSLPSDARVTDISPDGSLVLFSQSTSSQGDIMKMKLERR